MEVWRASLRRTTLGDLVAADDRLFAVTLEGKLYCFAATASSQQAGAGRPEAARP